MNVSSPERMVSDLDARAQRDLNITTAAAHRKREQTGIAALPTVAPVATVSFAKQPNPWPEPKPLTARIDRQPYPADALPPEIRAAVDEVHGFVKAPYPMVASSALAALSLAAQGHIDVQRAQKLSGPCGLFMLTIADSGERKSTCDQFFSAPIRDFEQQQAELSKPDVKRYTAELAAWSAERDGVLARIKQAGTKGEPTVALRESLVALESERPEPPRVPRIIFGDVTPEQLGYALAKCWPSAGVLSSEAGSVLGAHGMGKDSAMRNLALLNQLWDGATVTSDRRSTDSWKVRGARLTVALQIQEPTLREFLTKTGALARGSGFLARFLIGWPESTQGYRPFTDPPSTWPALAVFHRRIAALLSEPLSIDDEGALQPSMLTLSEDARPLWCTFHDAVEVELRDGGELRDVRDCASKTADNAARLAGLFHVFRGGGSAIGDADFERAAQIAAWHLHESRRFFNELALPVEIADAARLDQWLISQCQRDSTDQLSRREVQRLGPIRSAEAMAQAIKVLIELDRVRDRTEGKRRLIQINPALLEVMP